MTEGIRLAVTIGDPAGVGPEVALKALLDPELRGLAAWTLVGDRKALEVAARSCGIDSAQWNGIGVADPHLLDTATITPGAMRAEYGTAAMNYVRIATEMCLRGQADGMVTAPLNKEAVTLSGEQFSGHTEYIAQLCGAQDSRMLLTNERLSVVHVTTHIPLRAAVNLNQERIVRTIELGAEAVTFLTGSQPRIAVCGLNPHAGEHGLFGTEDEATILPAVQEANRRGIPCEGPVPPDTVFLKASRGAYDLIVAMYHDQGHIPMKLLDFERTVNITLGIPIIRTSVDHGTAFDIAGMNRADAENMKAAMNAAARMAAGKRSMDAARQGDRATDATRTHRASPGTR